MDVVVASATPLGTSALAVVRLTGDGLREVLSQFVEPFEFPHARARRVRVLDNGQVLDDGLMTYFHAPRSYTGQDLAEISLHGNPAIVERVLQLAIDAGARLADRGEFTRRALERGKLDLMGAEAVGQIGRATSLQGVQVARAALDGRVGAFLREARDRLVRAAAECEARLDYPGDELADVDDQVMLDDLLQLRQAANDLADTCTAGRAAVEGARVALVGAVNAGKSSLFNALVGRTRALVHDRPGTTRDVLEIPFQLDGVQVTLMDTAGERETDDPIEAAGLALARELVSEADLLLVVLRAGPLRPAEREILRRTEDTPRLVVYNGVDQTHGEPPAGALLTSAKTGQGLPELREALRHALGLRDLRSHTLVIASARQRDLIREVVDAIDEGIEGFEFAGVAVLADALTRGVEALDRLTGEDTREQILDALFARFCIGK